MNRNTQAHFANLPNAKIGRSKFNRSFTHKTTFNTGDLVPVYVDMDIVPGDTVSMKQSEIIRMMTPLAPVLDNSYLDFYWFFVPNRLVWSNFKKFMGENETAPWTMTDDVQIPQAYGDTTAKASGKLTRTVILGSLAEKMGIPPADTNWVYQDGKEISVSALPFRAYCLIWNEFFRDENLQNPVYIAKDNTDVVFLNQNNTSYISDPEAFTVSHEYKGGLPPLKVCKPHDYFTSALPGLQKGPAVTIPLSTEKVPVRIGKTLWDKNDPAETNEWIDTENQTGYNEEGQTALLGSYITTGDGYKKTLYANGKEYLEENAWAEPLANNNQYYVSLYSDLTEATGATITQLRQAFAIQKFYERDARGGTRYIENVLSHFGVQNPDYRLQRPEYLGGFRHYINVNQVIQSTPTISDSTPLGTTGAYSVTSNRNNDVFTKSFTEHGILLGLCCVRTDHTYQQGINRAWFKKKRLDFYSPEFSNLSEQMIYNKEIYAQGTSTDEEAFGYQEAWAEMRYMPDLVSGELRSTAAQSLDIWTYADYYDSKPTLGNKWIQETKNNMQRTLAVQNHDQFIADFYFGAVYTRPMPLYSVPGLIDHH